MGMWWEVDCFECAAEDKAERFLHMGKILTFAFCWQHSGEFSIVIFQELYCVSVNYMQGVSSDIIETTIYFNCRFKLVNAG